MRTLKITHNGDMREIGTENAGAYDSEFYVERQGMGVTVLDNDYYFTIRELGTDRPVGTLTRPRRFGRNHFWTAANLDGEIVAEAIGPRSAFLRFTKWMQDGTERRLAII